MDDDTDAMGKIRLEDVRRLDLHPGDTLVVALPANANPQQAHNASEFLQNRLDAWHPGCHVLVVTKDVDVSVIRQTDGEPG